MELNPLTFWPKYKATLPIHARLAAKVLSTPSTSSDCERLFSLSGRIFCKARAKLSAKHVNFRTCLCRWVNQNFDEEDDRASASAEKRQKRSLRFATLSLKLEVEGGSSSDEDDEEDDESEDETDIEAA
jgi:hypothetical protein